MKKIKKCFIFLTIILILAGSAFSESEDWKLVVKVDGTVQSRKENQDKWSTIWQSRMLKNGDYAQTLNKSRANIRFADQTVITVGENSVVEMSQFKMDKTSRTGTIKLITGKIRTTVGKFFAGDKTDIKVETPTAVLAARGTDFFVDQPPVQNQLPGANNLTVYVFEGGVSYSPNANPSQTFYIPGGSYLTSIGGVINISPFSSNSSVYAMVTDPNPSTNNDADLQSSQYSGLEGSPNPNVNNPNLVITATPPAPPTPPVMNPYNYGTGSLPLVIQ